ncbi:MAG: c-type cytochrome biogenesis protein CcsB [bacterium]
MPIDQIFVVLGMAAYMLAFCISVVQLFSDRIELLRWSTGFVWGGWLLHTAGFLVRWRATFLLGYDYFPVANRYEAFIFFSWSVVLSWLILKRWAPGSKIAAGMQFTAAILIAWAGLTSASDIHSLMPALRSNWLIFHVITCFLAYAAFAAAAFIALCFLISSKRSTADVADTDKTDKLLYFSVSIGFFLLTLGILTGSAWAQQAWGRYWGWDPKEVWSLITWAVYALFLHARISRRWSGKRLAILAVAGFLAVLFTFLGVNYLPFLQGLHSYA